MTVDRTRLVHGGVPAGPPAPPLLDPAGPWLILGGADPLVGPVSPDARTFFGPRGAAWFGPGRPLWVADTGHHRLLGWREAPTHPDQPADWVIGQPDFTSEGRNALGPVTRQTLNVPTGVTAFGRFGMAVSDAWNNRVLIWHRVPTASHVPPDVVLGQVDGEGGSPNRDPSGRGLEVGADTLHWPFQSLTVGDRLLVADTGNRRVLIWDHLPDHDGAPADRVLGQPDLHHRDDNGGGEPRSGTLRWPHDLALWGEDLVVADAGDHRVSIWSGVPRVSQAPARDVLGQPNFTATENNRGKYWPDARGMNMPYAVAGYGRWVLVADTANSRLLGFRGPFSGDVAAEALTGQPHFGAKGDNAWGPTLPTSLCWPYGLQVVGRTVVVCDTGNHRVLLWDLAPEIQA